MNIARHWRPVAIASVAAALAGGYVAEHRHTGAAKERGAESLLPTPEPAPAPTGNKAAVPDFSHIVASYGPAVVHIDARRTATGEEDFGQERHGDSIGSGFIISNDGYILTNNHVVEGAGAVSVKLADGRQLQATVIGTDPTFDVAVLKVEGNGLPAVKIGDPSKSKVGEWVVAIGSPYGLDNTVTSGIISAKARALSDDGPARFIQTDVPVNPGNSGGPLFNLDGEVIGINSMIYSRTGGYQGLSFAIPIDQAMRVREQLAGTGNAGHGNSGGGVAGRGYIGVRVQAVTRGSGSDAPGGALVADISPGSPAAAAGVEPGDIIVAVNGARISDPNELSSQVAQLPPGRSATFTVFRDGSVGTLTIVPGRQPAAPSQAG